MRAWSGVRSGVRNVLGLIVLAPLLGACATGARIDAMTASPSSMAPIAPSSPGFGAISLGTVTGGRETNPFGRSQVSDEDFRAALAQSLAASRLTAAGAGRYRLDAELVELDQPLIGLDITVTARVRYTLTPANGGAPRFDQMVETPYTAAFGEDVYGVERFRLADEGAMRANIESAMEKLTVALQASAATSS